MPGLFQAMEAGKRALLTHQYTLQTIGHNIANVNTPGYSRQRVSISATFPENSSIGQIGSGVNADSVRHIRDLFLGKQFREAQKSQGQWGYKEKSLVQIEALVNEPSENSINHLLDEFWNSWSNLSDNTDSSSNRALVVSKTRQLVNGINQLAIKLDSLRGSIDRDLRLVTDEVNRLTGQIAQINGQIKTQELGESRANDLRDARDYLTDELSKLIDVNTVEHPNGTTLVTMGAMMLVDGSDVIRIGTDTTNELGKAINNLVWENSDVKLRNGNGQLAGLMESRDEIIPRYQAQLDELAAALVRQVNSLHTTGYGLSGSTGISFFDPNQTDAINIRLNTAIEDNVNLIAASSQNETPTVGFNNQTALALADLRSQRIMADNSQSINEFYINMIGQIGVETNEAKSFTANYELLIQQIDNNRQAVQGVSLDEEMANLVKSQHAYDAAARVITSIDQALETVISRMGIVGR